MSRNKKNIIINDVEVADAGAEGNAIVRVDGMVVFVPYVVPGDIIDLNIFRKKKNYAEGRAIALKRPSPLRVEAPCKHFGVCGGCKWQMMDYASQLKYKQQQVRDALERIGHLDTSGMLPICGADKQYNYRNKLEFTFSSKRWLSADEIRDPEDPGDVGFHVPGVFDKVLPIRECHLQGSPSNEIRNSIRDYALEHKLPFYDIRNHTGFLRNVVIRNTSTGELMVIVIVAEQRNEWLYPLMDFLKEKFPQITSLLYIINEKMNDSYSDLEVFTYSGQGYITEQMPRPFGGDPLRFRINPKSFYQTNSEQAFKLYSHVARFAELKGDETLYDLYTGTGTIGQFLASKCRQVIGIEYIEAAIEDARLNASINGFDNCTFYAGDMAEVLTEEFVQRNGKPDIVVTDPPRAGMHDKVIAQLLNIRAPRIVYVSCNPATQARDLSLLSEAYDLGRIQPVDMFPHTHHVENIVELTLRNKK
ncbi:MAG: 23S rRNA (uracil(1939)-C(5))-methyltransferase RlmD [Bacteroidales bacterium]|nr:23S rRNA (uracil(1939)-C(5))-methyltransferase RlmD [Bacteroidales bacterium]